MLWRYSRRDTKVLLLATLLVFGGYALLLAQSWRSSVGHEVPITANTVGVFAGVEENGINTLAQNLDARERSLDAREAALRGGDAKTLSAVTVMGGVLLALILLNFYLDNKRRTLRNVGG